MNTGQGAHRRRLVCCLWLSGLALPVGQAQGQPAGAPRATPTMPAAAPSAAPAAEPTEAQPAVRQTALTASVVLKVVHPAQTRGGLVAAARELGGFPTLVTDDLLRLKVPPAQLSELLRRVAADGLVIEKSMERRDLTEQLAQLEGRIRSKEEIFEKLRGFLDSSGVEATLQIETNMTSLVQELERLKGELRVLQEQARWGEVDVAFRFQRRERITSVYSPFGWINTVDLDRFVRNF